MKPIISVLVLFSSLAPAAAQEWVVGAGYSDFSDDASEDRASVAVEYHFRPFLTKGRFDLGYGGALAVHTIGDFFFGFGMVGTYQIDDRWFLETSVVPGIFLESVSRNNLGSKFEIRSLLGIGYLLNSGNRLSIALTHKSNAGTASRNPGVNSVLIRLHREF